MSLKRRWQLRDQVIRKCNVTISFPIIINVVYYEWELDCSFKALCSLFTTVSK